MKAISHFFPFKTLAFFLTPLFLMVGCGSESDPTPIDQSPIDLPVACTSLETKDIVEVPALNAGCFKEDLVLRLIDSEFCQRQFYLVDALECVLNDPRSI